jgi:hypothetical protein
MQVTDALGQDWPSSLGDRVQSYEKSHVAMLVLYGLLLVGIPTAMAADKPVVDGATVVTQVADPLDKYRGATELTDTELVDMLSLVGFEGKALKTAWAVVMRESRGHPTSRNNTPATGDNSYGLFQINMIVTLGDVRREKFNIEKNSDLFDPVTNAKAAFYMTARGTNWGSWGLGPDAYDGSPEEPSVTQWLDKFPS